MKSLGRLLLVSAPFSVNWTLAWFGVFTFVNAYVARGLQRSDAAWTGLTLWFTGGMVFWMLVGTEIAARIGRRRFLVLAMIGASTVYLAIPWVRDLRLLGPLLVIESAMGASAIVVWLPMVAAAGGNRPGRNLAMAQWAAQVVGPVALLAGARLVKTERWVLVFSGMGALMFVSTALFAWWSLPLDRAITTPVRSLFRVRRADLRALLSGPFLLVLLAGSCMEPFNFHTMNQLWPNLARQLHGTPEELIGTVVALGRLPALIVLLIMAAVIDHLRPALCYGIGLIAAAGAVILCAGTPTQTAAVLAYLAFYCGHAIVWGSNSATTNAAAGPELRDPAFALLSVTMIGSVTLVGIFHNRLLAAGFDLPAVFRVCAAVAATGGLVLLVRAAVRPLRPVNPTGPDDVKDPEASGAHQ